VTRRICTPSAGAAARRLARSALALGLVSGSLLALAPGQARSADEQTVLEGSGICYPDGFDVNTVGTVRGKMRALTRPERGPVRFRLESPGETYTVLVSPRWFWPGALSVVPDGTEVLVVGSKSLGRDRTLYLIAQEISFPASGASLRLRDGDGRPLWMGTRRHSGRR
jgi:hypothetical protein